MHVSCPPRNPRPRRSPARHAAGLALLLALALSGCRNSRTQSAPPSQMASMHLSSPSLQNGVVPREFTCDGADRSPQLSWTTPPAGTMSLALTVIDPDAPAGTWVHWLVYNLPPATRELPAGIAGSLRLPDGSLQGRNDFGRVGYGGPCPPRGSTHRYFFHLLALDTRLDLPPGVTVNQFEAAMQKHILAHAELMARYGH